MKKIMALYRMPPDVDAFMAHYRGTHLPLTERIPGLLRTEVTRVTRTLAGEEGNYLLAELYFDDEAFGPAMRSAENAATGADLANFAEGLVTVMAGEVLAL